MIPEPVTTAITVAKLIDTGGKIAMKLYSFITAIVEAPDHIRAVVSGLYALNTSLCQIQTLLLEPSFGTMHSEIQLKELEDVLQDCVRAYSRLEPKAEKASKVLEGNSKVKKLWVDVKWVFDGDTIEEMLRSLEGAKSSLTLIVNTFTLCGSFTHV